MDIKANENPEVSASGSGNCSLLTGSNTPDNTRPAHIAQAKIELLHDDLGSNISALQVSLDCAYAMRLAGDTTGLVYSLRRARAYWKAITGSAAELVATDAELRSALRQGGAGQ